MVKIDSFGQLIPVYSMRLPFRASLSRRRNASRLVGSQRETTNVVHDRYCNRHYKTGIGITLALVQK